MPNNCCLIPCTAECATNACQVRGRGGGAEGEEKPEKLIWQNSSISMGSREGAPSWAWQRERESELSGTDPPAPPSSAPRAPIDAPHRAAEARCKNSRASSNTFPHETKARETLPDLLKCAQGSLQEEAFRFPLPSPFMLHHFAIAPCSYQSAHCSGARHDKERDRNALKIVIIIKKHTSFVFLSLQVDKESKQADPPPTGMLPSCRAG